jgi:hypothetical protein
MHVPRHPVIDGTNLPENPKGNHRANREDQPGNYSCHYPRIWMIVWVSVVVVSIAFAFAWKFR